MTYSVRWDKETGYIVNETEKLNKSSDSVHAVAVMKNGIVWRDGQWGLPGS